MRKFSANLGFLWKELPLPDAIRAAKNAGFDAVECHWPYETNPDEINAALAETGLPMLGLNTLRGDAGKGEAGLAALPGRGEEARAHIDQAIAYAAATGTANIHVMAGIAQGSEAESTFVDNLRHATEAAAAHGKTVLIEPLNHYDFPGYLLTTTSHARRIIEAVGAANLKLMYDCYNLQLMEGDLSHKIKQNLDIIGHIQFAAVPSRGNPDQGEIDYAHIFALIDELGYTAPLGAEYKPDNGDTEASLGWLKLLRN